jgi:hypothetical protein
MNSLVSIKKHRYGTKETVTEEWLGKSSDEKPNLPADRNGSTFYEMDTQKAYMYDGAALAWVEQ